MSRFDSMMADFAIQISALKKIYGGRPILSDVNLAIRPGEAVALLGANGAGKTTLLRILATLSRPSRGTAVVAGHDCVKHAERVRERVGFVAHGAWVDEDLAAFKAGGGSVLLTTHSFGRGLGVADRIVILAGGTVVLDTPGATLSPDDVRRLYEAHAERSEEHTSELQSQ